MKEKKYTVIDLFCGCGGLSLGFERAGFKPVLAIDVWKDALTTYEFNNLGVNTLCADISMLNPLEIKRKYDISEVDVITKNPKLLSAQELTSIVALMKKTDKESFIGALDEWYDKWQVARLHQ